MTDDTFTITDEQRDYSQFGLEENPFPYSPVPDDDPELYCGQEHATRRISDTVSTMLSTGKSKHLVITAKYGNGKSHTLKYTRSLVRDREDVIVGYVAQPGEGFRDIYHEFMYDLGFDRVQDLAARGEAYLLNSLNPFRLEGQKTIGLEILEEFRDDEGRFPLSRRGALALGGGPAQLPGHAGLDHDAGLRFTITFPLTQEESASTA